MENNEMVRQVLDSRGGCASEMTHSLCALGNHDMGEGILTLWQDGVKKGVAIGVRAGVKTGEEFGIRAGMKIGVEAGMKAGEKTGLVKGVSIASLVFLSGILGTMFVSIHDRERKSRKTESGEMSSLNAETGTTTTGNAADQDSMNKEDDDLQDSMKSQKQ